MPNLYSKPIKCPTWPRLFNLFLSMQPFIFRFINVKILLYTLFKLLKFEFFYSLKKITIEEFWMENYYKLFLVFDISIVGIEFSCLIGFWELKIMYFKWSLIPWIRIEGWRQTVIFFQHYINLILPKYFCL